MMSMKGARYFLVLFALLLSAAAMAFSMAEIRSRSVRGDALRRRLVSTVDGLGGPSGALKLRPCG